MIDLGGLLTAAAFVTAMPTFLGILMAYSVISIIVGSLLWISRTIPNDIGIVATGSGILIGTLLIGTVVLINTLII